MMPTARPNLIALRTCLQQETDLVDAFVELLQREANTLAAGAENDTLTALATDKNNYATQLSECANKRNELLIALGYGIDKTGLEAMVRDHPDLYDTVRQLLDQTAQASILNTGNGRIIDRFLSHNQRALDVLKHLTGRGELYDALGRKQSTARPTATHIKAS